METDLWSVRERKAAASQEDDRSEVTGQTVWQLHTVEVVSALTTWSVKEKLQQPDVCHFFYPRAANRTNAINTSWSGQTRAVTLTYRSVISQHKCFYWVKDKLPSLFTHRRRSNVSVSCFITVTFESTFIILFYIIFHYQLNFRVNLWWPGRGQRYRLFSMLIFNICRKSIWLEDREQAPECTL